VSTVLETRDVTHTFGSVKAADHLSVRFDEGQIVGIVGPNGSGKTTFVNIVTGYVKPTQGQVLFRGRDVTGLDPRQLTKLGITRSFQIPQLYTRLSILENMLIALCIRAGQHSRFWQPLKAGPTIKQALEILDKFGFATAADGTSGAEQRVETLPEGGRKLLDIALSFALGPRLLLLDEPTSGVSVDEKFGVMDTLVSVFKKTGLTTVFIEHDLDVVARYAERILVFSEGSILADGGPERVFASDDVRRHLLGEGA
jgi:branched-chain amino acid transport system ATP-binding protein